jgi:hypothetical protein
LTPAQKASINTIYEHLQVTRLFFKPNNRVDQDRAIALLRANGLDRVARNRLESRWNIQWSNGWKIEKGKDERRRYLFQWYITQAFLIQLMHMSTSSSGYDTMSRNATELKKPSARVSSKPTSRHDAWVRRNPYDFTGCLAHAELTEQASDGAVSTVVGYFIHNESCQQSVMKRLPPVPLHPHVYEIALAQLEGGAKWVPPVLSAVARLMPLQPSVHTIEESPHD